MVRIARVIANGIPHHVTQRGNRRMPTFFSDEDYQAYIALSSRDAIFNSKQNAHLLQR